LSRYRPLCLVTRMNGFGVCRLGAGCRRA